jgi:hypothetical protein
MIAKQKQIEELRKLILIYKISLIAANASNLCLLLLIHRGGQLIDASPFALSVPPGVRYVNAPKVRQFFEYSFRSRSVNGVILASSAAIGWVFKKSNPAIFTFANSKILIQIGTTDSLETLKNFGFSAILATTIRLFLYNYIVSASLLLSLAILLSVYVKSEMVPTSIVPLHHIRQKIERRIPDVQELISIDLKIDLKQKESDQSIRKQLDQNLHKECWLIDQKLMNSKCHPSKGVEMYDEVEALKLHYNLNDIITLKDVLQINELEIYFSDEAELREIFGTPVKISIVVPPEVPIIIQNEVPIVIQDETGIALPDEVSMVVQDESAIVVQHQIPIVTEKKTTYYLRGSKPKTQLQSKSKTVTYGSKFPPMHDLDEITITQNKNNRIEQQKISINEDKEL